MQQKKKEGWKDQNIKGSATTGKDDGGNVYFSYKKDSSYVDKGIVYVYNEHQKGYYLIECLKQKKEIDIPAYIDGKPVVHIGQRAFFQNKHITKVVIPETVAYIWHRAFMDCSSLEEVVCHSNNLSKILAYSFAECSSLKTIVLPSFVTYLQSYAFMNCGEIDKMVVPVSLITIGSGVFDGTTIKEIDYLGSEENFKNLSIDSIGNEGFTGAKINFLNTSEIVKIDDFNQLNSIAYGTIVEVEGYVTLYANNKYIFLINEDNSQGIQIYLGYYRGDLPQRNAKVKITGTWSKYTGQSQIASVENIETIEENALKAAPIEVTIEEVEKNPELYQCRYLLFTGRVHSTTASPSATTYFAYSDGSRADIFLFGKIIPTLNEEVKFFGTVVQYNLMFQLFMDFMLEA